MENVRLDKWLWAARFFKTRSLAAKAIQGGRVHLNDKRIKPSRAVSVGDKVRISKGEIVFDIEVCGLSIYRRPASEARLLYEESEKSLQNRTEQREMKRLLRISDSPPARKPDKRDRRKIRDFIRKN